MICKNMSKRCIINNYSAAKYYFLRILNGGQCKCNYNLYTENEISARLRKKYFFENWSDK